MKVGVTIERFGGLEPARLVELARLFGVEMVEVNPSAFEDVRGVAAALGGMPTGLHLPLIGQDGYDFSCPAFQERIDALVEAVNSHHRHLHLHYVLAHPPEPAEAEKPIETSEELLLENLSRLDLPIVIENVPSWDSESFRRFYHAAKGRLGEQLWGMCFDAPHAFLQGIDPAEEFKRCSAEVRVIHLSDCGASEDSHLPFGCGGVLPIDGFLDAVREQRFDGFLVLEIQPASIRELRPLVQSYLQVQRRLQPLRYLPAKIRAGLAALRLRTRGLPSSASPSHTSEITSDQ